MIRTQRHRWSVSPFLSRAALALLLLLGGGVAGVGAAEVFLRAFGYSPGGPFTVSQGEFAEIPGIFAPSQQLISEAIAGLPHKITINSLGYRGAEIDRLRPEGTLRVVFLGDSFAWGDHVDDESSLPAKLEAFLRARCQSAVEVVNAGIPSTTILAHLPMFERSMVLDPQIAILQFYENDLEDLVTTRMWEQLELNRERKSGFPLKHVYPLARRTALWTFALDVTRTWRVRKGVSAGAESSRRQAAPSAAAEAEYSDLFRRLVDAAEREGVVLYFVAYPGAESVRRGQATTGHSWALNSARRLGVPSIDLLPPLVGAAPSPEDLFLLPKDGHPSPLGYSIASTVIGEFLLNAADGGCREGASPPTDVSSAPPPTDVSSGTPPCTSTLHPHQGNCI